MATKDYVKRGRAPRKKTNTRKAAPRRRVPFMWIIIALIALSGFIYGLYLLKTAPKPAPSQPAPVAQPKASTQKAKPTKTEKAAPTPPQTEWRYEELLENKEVKIKTPEKQPSKPSRPYLMQCGSFRDPAVAESLRAQIIFQNMDNSQVRRAEGKNGVWYKVVLGPYPQKRQAERDRNQLRRAGIEGCEIWYWNL